MNNKASFFFTITMLTLGVFLYSCNSGSDKSNATQDSSAATVSSLNSYDFSQMQVDHSALPILDYDTIKDWHLTVGEYYDSSSKYDALLQSTQADTSLPREKQKQLIKAYSAKKRQIHDYAYIMKVRSQCGENNKTIDVEGFMDQAGITRAFVLQRAKPVGLLNWNKFDGRFEGPNDKKVDVEGRPWGTGALIADDLFITALHCFQPDVDYSATPVKEGHKLQNNELCLLMRVIFGYQYRGTSTIQVRDTCSFPVIELVETGQKYGLDYAIVRLGKNMGALPGAIFGHFTALSTSDTRKGDTLCIIQHPQGSPKRVGNGKVTDQDGTYIYYDAIDTYSCSSGSPVVNYSSGALEGVHVGGNCTQSGHGANRAIKIQVIRKISAIFPK